MLVQMLPGTNRENLEETLTDLASSAGNLRGQLPAHGLEALSMYLNWATTSAKMLRGQVRESDIDALIFTPRLQVVLNAGGAHPGAGFVSLLRLEVDERCQALEAARDALRAQIKRWARMEFLVGIDSSFAVHYPDKLGDVDFQQLLDGRVDNVHVLIPMQVIDELDALKDRGKDDTRTRARQALAYLDAEFTAPKRIAEVSPEFLSEGQGRIPRGAVTMEILFDPPGHTRLPIVDEEIIDRLVAVAPVAGKMPTLLTFDTAQALRARKAGLKVKKLSHSTKTAPAVKGAASDDDIAQAKPTKVSSARREGAEPSASEG